MGLAAKSFFFLERFSIARLTDVKIDRELARPVPKAVPARRGPALWERVVRYLREVRAELVRVDWPTRPELIASTIVVVVVLLVLAAYLGAWDALFTYLLTKLSPGR